MRDNNIKPAEAADILRVCKGYVIALAIEGKKLSSEALAEKMQKYLGKGTKTLLQNGCIDAIILMYESWKCERGGNASLFC